MKNPFDYMPTLDEMRNVNITMALSVHEWRILAASALKAHLRRDILVRDEDRQIARELARKIAEQTGKYPKT